MTTIDLTKREVRVLLDSLEEANRTYVSKGGSRDFAWEDEHDALEKKLNEALQKESQSESGNVKTLNVFMVGIILAQVGFFVYMFLFM